MNKITLTDIIKEILDEESKLSAQAKSLGLTNMGFGRWGKNGKVTHHSDGERLVPKDPKAKLNPSKEVPKNTDKSFSKKPDMSNKPKSNTVGVTVGTNQKKQTSGDDSPVVSVKPSNRYMGNAPSGPAKIPKTAHKTPEVHDKVADAMSKFEINKNGWGGGFVWNKESEAYEYDDGEGGYEYSVTVKPLDNDEYEVTVNTFGYGDKKPVVVGGLTGVKKELEDRETEFEKN